MPAPAPIHGTCAPRFAAVRAEFERNFAERDEVGAAVAVVIDGELAIDLWGGWGDENRTRPWERDTIVNVWSVGKAVSAICLLRLVDEGRVELDAPVARYWPEFAQSGKQLLPVRQILNHQAGLHAISKPLPPGFNILSWDGMVEALAEQKPWWEPGTRFGYHTNTYGFLVGEIVRRVTGRSIGAFLREEIGDPCDVDFLVGFGPEHDHRVADWINYVSPREQAELRPWLLKDPARLSGIELSRVLAYRNPPPHPEGDVNSRLWRGAEFPSTSPHGNARAIARLFGALAAGGALEGRRVLSPETIERANTIESDGEDSVLGRPNRFGLGFQLTIPGVRPLGRGERAFGHYGNGGLLGFADPDARLGFSYVCNRSGRSWRDPRNIALIDAVYEAV